MSMDDQTLHRGNGGADEASPTIYRLEDPIRKEELTRVTNTEAETRDWLTRILVVFSIVAIGVAGIVSLANWSWTPLAATWAIIAPYFGRISTTYYRHSN